MVVSPCGEVTALVASTGTKALILDSDGQVIREVDRSYYCAHAYRYPLALFTLLDGRTGLAHCPDSYDRLEVEVALTGERLTTDVDREPQDFFHSRLAVSPDGRYLLSAGWVWHPYGCVAVYDLHRTLAGSTALNPAGTPVDPGPLVQAEVSGACFLDQDVVLSTSAEPNDPEGPEELVPDTLARWSTTTGTFLWRRQLDTTAGDLIPIAGDVLALHGHPRLFDGETGSLIAEWPEIDTGHSDGPLVGGDPFSGPARVAVDQTGPRFAVTDGDQVKVVHLG
ncbi:hypothetical protein [Actinokineospora bangkokensis]|uniref:Uncharacterized protein n=1 Tax=Actinokineospora bangkokensis TaxID=1193682 RepID=A0A1Q9LSS4_9PSEU|nr:hypothetical protein [Actinokineospora bangkokensis]OLR95086.1 hypothetical protein BJP25_09090 [Actinokineospora bangkokensis]